MINTRWGRDCATSQQSVESCCRCYVTTTQRQYTNQNINIYASTKRQRTPQTLEGTFFATSINDIPCKRQLWISDIFLLSNLYLCSLQTEYHHTPPTPTPTPNTINLEEHHQKLPLQSAHALPTINASAICICPPYNNRNNQ